MVCHLERHRYRHLANLTTLLDRMFLPDAISKVASHSAQKSAKDCIRPEKLTVLDTLAFA
jgi:hypothetical protein